MIEAAVREVMQTDVPTASPSTTVRDLVDLFVDNRISAAPVVDESGVLVGLVTESDLLLQEVEGEGLHQPFVIPFFDAIMPIGSSSDYEEEMRKSFAATVDQLMNDEIRTIGPDASVHQAALEMHRHDISRLPVVEDGKLVGMISRSDVVRALARYEFGSR